MDNDGFSTVSVCKYSLPYGDFVPDAGSRMCKKACPWWKSPCQVDYKHTLEWTSPSIDGVRRYAVRRTPTGVLVSKHVSSNGDWIVKVRSFQQLQTGDKVFTGHGQKGVVTIKSYEDMPRALLRNRSTAVSDMVLAMSSIICRQTNGQLYEMHKSVGSLKRSQISVVQAGEKFDVSEEVLVTKSASGKLYMTCFEGGVMRPTRASAGFVRVHNQTQMTRERHFTSHRKIIATTLRTPTRRTRGGGVAYGEKEVQAAVTASLTNCRRNSEAR